MTERRAEQLEPPSDPWAATAPVLPPTSMMAQADPYVIVVERPRRRRWPWVLGTLAALGGLCCVGVLAVWTPISKEYPAHLEMADQVAGLDRDYDPEITRAAEQMIRQMRRDHGVDDAVAVMLTDPGTRDRRVILVSATKLTLDPAGELDNAIRSVGNDKLRDLTGYPALGANVTCANSEDDQNNPVVICAWVDHGSLGAGIFYGSWTMDDCATTLRDLRDAIVRRG